MSAYETREAVAQLAEMDPELVQASWCCMSCGRGRLNTLQLFNSGQPVGWAATGMPVNSMEEAVSFLRGVTIPEPPSTPLDTTLDIPLREERTARARVHRAAHSPPGPAPLVVYVHGGGFVMGAPAHVAPQARAIAAATGAVVVTPTYRLAPEHPFPAAQNDIWDTLNWLARPENASTIGADVTAGFVLGGISAGANLAACAAQRYVSQGTGVPLTGVMLVVPAVLQASIVPEKYKHLWFSLEQNANAPIIDRKALEFTERSNKPDYSSPLCSPFNDPNPHVGMPPVYIHVAGLDPLRDDGLVYERVLREHGVKTRLDVYPGVPHGHLGMFPTLSASRKADLDLVKAAAWILGKDLSNEDAATAVAAAAVAAKLGSAV